MSMRKRVSRIVQALTLTAAFVHAQPERNLIHAAAEALGGTGHIQGIKTLIIEGRGKQPNIGQNVTPDAPLPDWNVPEFKRIIDLAHGRMRLQQHRVAEFPFSMANDVHQDMLLDGTIAFNLDAAGKAVRASAAAVRER